MLRFLKQRRYRWLRGGILAVGVTGFCLQMWHVPEVMGQELSERSRQEMMLQARRAERTYVDQTRPVAKRLRDVAHLLRAACRDVGRQTQTGEDYGERLGDLDILERMVTADHAEMRDRAARLRAQLVSRSVDPAVLGRLDEFTNAMEARTREISRLIRLVKREREQPDRLRQRLNDLNDYLSPRKPRPQGEVEHLPRQGLRLEPKVAAAPPLFQFPWALAGPEDIIGDLLVDLAGADAAQGDPVPADTAVSAPEIVFDEAEAGLDCSTGPLTDPIVVKACDLGRDPVKIYEYVRNEFTYEPYLGSVKGAARTLAEEGGNDIDLASLLIALLRASGVPARYEFGTIEMPIEDASAWIGIDDGNQVVSFFRKNGVPIEADYVGAEPETIRLDHVWVKAFVDVFPYRGAGGQDDEGDAWVEMDPSFKQHTFSGTNVRGAVSISPSSLRTNALGPAIRTADSVTEIDHDLVQMDISSLSTRVRNFLAAESLMAENVFRRRVVEREEFGVHPLSDQYRIASRGMSFRRLPDSLRHRLTIRLVNVDGTTESLVYSADLPALVGKRIVLSYRPTPDSEPLFDDRLATGSDIDDFNATLFNLIPQIHVDGVLAVSAHVDSQYIKLGHPQRLEVSFTSPAEPHGRRFVHDLTAGGVHALVLNAQQVTDEEIASTQAALSAFGSGQGVSTLDPSLGIEATIGQLLHGIGISYYHQADRFNQITAGNLGVAIVRHPSVVRVSWDMDVTTIPSGDYELIARARPDSVCLDIVRDAHEAVGIRPPSAGSDFSPEEQFVFTAALTSNALESNALLQALAASDGASVVRTIEEANGTPSDPSDEGNPIYTVTRANIDSLPSVISGLPMVAAQEVEAAVRSRGEEVTLIADAQVIGSERTYVGIIMRDLDTSDSRFMLVDAQGDSVSSAQIATSDISGATPDYVQMLRFDGSGTPYTPSLATAAVWLSVLRSATDNTGLWYIPAIIDVNEWFGNRTSIDPETVPLAALAVAAPIGRFSREPAILNVAATIGNDHGAESGWVALGTLDDPDANSVRITADVTRGGAWTVEIRDPNNDVVGTPDTGSTPRIDVTRTFSTPPDGTYSYRITAHDPLDQNIQAVAVSGTFRVDLTPPNVAATTEIPSAPPGRMHIRGQVQDLTSFDRYEIRVSGQGFNPPDFTPPTTTVSDALVNAGIRQFHGITGQLDPIIFTLDTTPYQSISEVRLIAYDTAGNESEAVVSAIDPLVNPPLQDTVRPVVTALRINGTAVAPGEVVTAGEVTIDVSASDQAPTPAGLGDGALDRIELLVDGAKVDELSLSTSPASVTQEAFVDDLALYGFPSGDRTIGARAVDIAGNVSEVFEFPIISAPDISNFRVTPPVATLSNPQVVLSAAVPSGASWQMTVSSSAGVPVAAPFTGQGPTVNVAVDVGAPPQGLDLPDGSYTATLLLTASGASGEISFEVNRIDAAPAVAIDNLPEPDLPEFDPSAGRTPAITEGIFDLRGIVLDPDSAVQYRIELRDPVTEATLFVAFPDDPGNAAVGSWVVRPPNGAQESWTVEIPQGSQPGLQGDGVAPILASLDLTLVPNGVYKLALMGRSVPGPAADEDVRRIVLDTPLKVGQFAFSQQDLVAPTSGLPLTVIRSYNSFERGKDGPFGHGWQFALNDLQVSLAEQRYDDALIGYGEPIEGSAGSVRNSGLFDRDVTLTLPDGRRVTFAFGLERVPASEDSRNAQGFTQVYRPIYYPPPGVMATLRTLHPHKLITPLAGSLHWESTEEAGIGGATEPEQHHDISGWILRTEDGSEYIIERRPIGGGLVYNEGLSGVYIDKVWGEPYLAAIVAPSGETVELLYESDDLVGAEFNSPDPNATAPIRGIAFARDGNDRIISIYGPGQVEWDSGSDRFVPDFTKPPAFWYGYDAHGNLEEVHRVLAPPAGWNPGVDPTDPPASMDGWTTEVTTFVYDDDSDPGETSFPEPADHLIVSIEDPRGLQPLVSEYDDDGRLIATIDAYGNRIELGRNTAEEIEGLRSETIFDRGNPPTATTHYYDSRGNVVLTVDAAGRQISREYYPADTPQADLLHREFINGELQAEYEYDDRGNRTRIVDALGNETLYDYVYNPDTDLLAQVTITTPSQTDGGQPTVTTNEYDERQNLIRTLSGATETINVYDPTSNRLTGTQVVDYDANGNPEPPRTVSSFGYDPATGELTSTTQHGKNGQDFTQTFGYDDAGNQERSSYVWTDGVTTKSVSNWTRYDAAKRPIDTYRWIENAAAPTETFPDLSQGTTPSGLVHLSTTYYNSVGQVIATVDHLNDPDGPAPGTNLGPISTTLYDARGNAIESAEWRDLSDTDLTVLLAWLRAPSPANPPPADKNPLVTRTFYDENGRPVLVCDRLPYASYPAPPEKADFQVGSGAPGPFAGLLGTDDQVEILGSRTSYDALGRTRDSARVKGVAISIDYSSALTASTVPSAPGTLASISSSQTDYDALGRVLSTVSNGDAATTYEYWPNGQQKYVRQTDDQSRLLETFFDYYPSGQQRLVRDARGGETTFRYDAQGRRTHTELHHSEDGAVYTLQTVYDHLGRHVAEIDPLGNERAFGYDERGRLTSVTLPAVRDDTSATPTQHVSPVYTYDYDVYGNLISITDPELHETTFAYDHFNRQVSRTLPYTDSTGSTQSIHDDEVVETREYDEVTGRLTVERSFHTPGNPSEANTTVYLYDSHGRLEHRVHYPPGATVDTGAFNPASTEWEVAYEFTYDALDRQKSVQQWTRLKDDADGSSQTILSGTTTHHFDAEGRLAKLDTPQGYLVYTYDSAGRLLSTQVAQSADVDGQPAGPISLEVGYTYDSLGRLKTIERGSDRYTYTYNRNGSRESLAYSNDDGASVQILTQYEYDSLNRLDHLTHWDETQSPPQILSQYDYTIRPDGRRRSVVDTRREIGGVWSEVSYTYEYDDIGRLTKEVSAVTSPNGSRLSDGAYDYTHEYFFDKSGNRTRQVVTDSLGADSWIGYEYYDGGKDRLFKEIAYGATSADDVTTIYDYNLNGFLTLKRTNIQGAAHDLGDPANDLTDDEYFRYLPNAEDRLAAAYISQDDGTGTNTLADGQAVLFNYDHNGIKTRRYQATTIDDAAALASASLIDASNHTGYAQVIQERQSDGTPTRSYVIGDDVLTQLDGALPTVTANHFLYDGYGSTRLLANSAGASPVINGQFDYDAYGNAIGFDAPTATTNLLYTGEQLDQSEQVGMYYLRARWYEPAIGAFRRMDPFPGIQASPLSLHKYVYTHNDPISGSDPSGLLTLGSILHGTLIAATVLGMVATGLGVFFAGRRFVGGAVTGLRLASLARDIRNSDLDYETGQALQVVLFDAFTRALGQTLQAVIDMYFLLLGALVDEFIVGPLAALALFGLFRSGKAAWRAAVGVGDAIGAGGTWNRLNRIPRTTGRSLRYQPDGISCGPTAVGMVVETVGGTDAWKFFDFNLGRGGTTASDLAAAMRASGIDGALHSRVGRRQLISALAEETAGGNPVIAFVNSEGGVGHFVVVDEVTRINGHWAVAIRDPIGGVAYFEKASTFTRRSNGSIVTID